MSIYTTLLFHIHHIFLPPQCPYVRAKSLVQRLGSATERFLYERTNFMDAFLTVHALPNERAEFLERNVRNLRAAEKQLRNAVVKAPVFHRKCYDAFLIFRPFDERISSWDKIQEIPFHFAC